VHQERPPARTAGPGCGIPLPLRGSRRHLHRAAPGTAVPVHRGREGAIRRTGVDPAEELHDGVRASERARRVDGNGPQRSSIAPRAARYARPMRSIRVPRRVPGFVSGLRTGR
jgi:hypothetical protein